MLSFLKKDKKKEDALDLPPPPPSFEGEGSELPEFPEMNADAPIPESDFNIEMPKFPDIPDMAMPEAPEDLPEEEPAPIEKAPLPKPDIKAEPKKEAFFERPTLFSRPSSFERPKTEARKRHVFVKVDDFRKVLGTINSIRADLRRSDEALLKLETIKSTKDKSFDKMKFLLEDAQKKLVFMDKTLFKGE